MNASIDLLRRMVCVAAFLALLNLSGCRPADPLDQKVAARSPADFDEWWEHARDDFNDTDATEIDHALAAIEAATPRLHASADENTNDPFCRRIAGQTLRHILVMGYEGRNNTLLQRILIETGHLEDRLRNAPEDRSPAEAREEAAIVDGRKKYIEQMSAEVEKNKTRIAELTTAPTKT